MSSRLQWGVDSQEGDPHVVRVGMYQGLDSPSRTPLLSTDLISQLQLKQGFCPFPIYYLSFLISAETAAAACPDMPCAPESLLAQGLCSPVASDPLSVSSIPWTTYAPSRCHQNGAQERVQGHRTVSLVEKQAQLKGNRVPFLHFCRRSQFPALPPLL